VLHGPRLRAAGRAQVDGLLCLCGGGLETRRRPVGAHSARPADPRSRRSPCSAQHVCVQVGLDGSFRGLYDGLLRTAPALTTCEAQARGGAGPRLLIACPGLLPGPRTFDQSCTQSSGPGGRPRSRSEITLAYPTPWRALGGGRVGPGRRTGPVRRVWLVQHVARAGLRRLWAGHARPGAARHAHTAVRNSAYAGHRHTGRACRCHALSSPRARSKRIKISKTITETVTESCSCSRDRTMK
jgi:hypothetical protein